MSVLQQGVFGVGKSKGEYGGQEVRLQNVLFPTEIYCEEMYLRASYKSSQHEPFVVPRGGRVRTDTYMNAFDIGTWKKYTDISNLSLCIKVHGSVTIACFWEGKNRKPVRLFKEYINAKEEKEDKRSFPIVEFYKMKEGILYFELWAETDSVLEAWFATESKAERQIKLSLVICTYKRKKQLEQIIKVLKKGRKNKAFCQQESETEDTGNWLKTFIVDNASEIEDAYGDGIVVCHNPNLGGSGGFSKGMDEVVSNLHDFEATHVILMDDDVVIQMESFYRLRRLLTFLKPEYEAEVISGRMFRMDKPWVQYTAVEIWNDGDIGHVGWNQDMTERQYLWDMNDNTGGEYSGWWFACFPIGFVKNNRPLPFFLHCDDVEYGLRHGGTPIILNGIQVWHETYEYRQSPVIAYYDYRNSLIVNALHGSAKADKKQVWKQFKQKITEVHVKKDYILEYFLIRAFRDYLRGMKWFMEKDDMTMHTALMKKKRVCRYGNSIRWRIAFLVWKRG